MPLDMYDERGNQVDAIAQERESYEHIMDPLRKSGPPRGQEMPAGDRVASSVPRADGPRRT
eukprot:3089266-Pyramimonas_sp.AAC.1